MCKVGRGGGGEGPGARPVEQISIVWMGWTRLDAHTWLIHCAHYASPEGTSCRGGHTQHAHFERRCDSTVSLLPFVAGNLAELGANVKHFRPYGIAWHQLPEMNPQVIQRSSRDHPEMNPEMTSVPCHRAGFPCHVSYVCITDGGTLVSPSYAVQPADLRDPEQLRVALQAAGLLLQVLPSLATPQPQPDSLPSYDLSYPSLLPQ